MKRDILTRAYTPDEIAVLYRSQEDYYSRFITGFQREGIPFAGEFEMPLGTNPAVNTLLQWYEILAGNYSRTDLLQWLQSAYISPEPAATKEQLARLYEISLRAQILEGKRDWIARLQQYLEQLNENAGSPVSDADDRQLITQMLHFLNDLPEEKTATWPEHLRDLKKVIKFTHFAECISPAWNASGGREMYDVIARDMRAYGKLREVLDSLDHLSQAFTFEDLSTEQFVKILRDVLQNTPYQVEVGNSSGVTLTNIEGARGLHWRKVYVVGLIDGIFPVQWRPHPLVQLADRTRINRTLPKRMEIVEHRADLAEERLLFYIAVTRATEALRISTVRGQEDLLPSQFYEDLSMFYGDSPDAQSSLYPYILLHPITLSSRRKVPGSGLIYCSTLGSWRSSMTATLRSPHPGYGISGRFWRSGTAGNSASSMVSSIRNKSGRTSQISCFILRCH